MEDTHFIDFNRFKSYLEGLGSKIKPCYFCGNSSWKLKASTITEINKESFPVGLALPWARTDIGAKKAPNNGEVMLNNSFHILSMTCSDCGHTHLFDHEMVLKLFNDNNPLKEDGSE